MIVPVSIRGFLPRPWKAKDNTQKYSGTFVLLDTTPRAGAAVMDTVSMELDFASEADLVKAAQLVGKSAQAVVTGLRTGVDGKPRLVGTIEEAK